MSYNGTGLPEKKMAKKTEAPEKKATKVAGGTGLPEKRMADGVGLSEKKAGGVKLLGKRATGDAPEKTTAKAEKPGGADEFGKKADLYIVHGWTYTVEPWAHTLAIMRQHGYKVEMLHVPGLTEPSTQEFAIADYVAWADAQIPDGALALGHSNGGRILLNLCAQKPKKLRQLVLLDAAGVYEASAKKRMVRKLAAMGRPLKRIPLVDKAFHKLTGTTDYSRAPANMKVTLTNMLESDKTLDFSKVLTPTMILWGKKDTTTPPRHATQMYEQLPNADLKFFAEWTHAPYISNPVELAKVLEGVIERGRK